MKQFFGGLLLAIGILLAAGSGLCTLFVIGSGMGSGAGGLWVLAIVIGAVPFALGIGLFVIGRNLLREP